MLTDIVTALKSAGLVWLGTFLGTGVQRATTGLLPQLFTQQIPGLNITVDSAFRATFPIWYPKLRSLVAQGPISTEEALIAMGVAADGFGDALEEVGIKQRLASFVPLLG